MITASKHLDHMDMAPSFISYGHIVLTSHGNTHTLYLLGIESSGQVNSALCQSQLEGTIPGGYGDYPRPHNFSPHPYRRSLIRTEGEYGKQHLAKAHIL